MKFIMAAAVAMGTWMIQAEDGFLLVENGQPRAAIVIPEAPSKVVQYAAEELKHHIRLITGCELPLVSENKRTQGIDKFIRLGDPGAKARWGIDVEKLPINSTVRKVTDDTVYLFGLDGDGTPPLNDSTPMGTLFAVYDFLNTQLGVRWLWPGESGTYVRRRSGSRW